MQLLTSLIIRHHGTQLNDIRHNNNKAEEPCHERNTSLFALPKYRRQYFVKTLNVKLNINKHLEFNQAHDLIEKLTKHDLFHLIIVMF